MDRDRDIQIRAGGRPAPGRYEAGPEASGYGAHCDARILHAPGVCSFCDGYPQRQFDRVQQRINFTGEHDPDKSPCPADAARGDDHQLWAGNLPPTDPRVEGTLYDPNLVDRIAYRTTEGLSWGTRPTPGYPFPSEHDELLAVMPPGAGYSANRYDTDDEMVLTVWKDDVTYDFRAPRLTFRPVPLEDPCRAMLPVRARPLLERLLGWLFR